MSPVALVAANAVALRADARGARARSRRDRATMRHRGTTPLPVDAARVRRAVATASNVSAEAADATDAATSVSRRVVGAASLLASLLSGPAAPALATPPRATFQVAESDFKPLPGTKPPIMYADIKGGAGVEGGAKDGSRVGVTKAKNGKSRARVSINGKVHCLGTFDTSPEAAVASKAIPLACAPDLPV